MSELFTRELRISNTEDTRAALDRVVEHIQCMQRDLIAAYERQRREQNNDNG